jgi:capsular polysaccharide biosynthesis protein
MDTAEQEISLDEIIDVIKRRWKFILFPSIIISVIAGIILAFQPKTYEAYSLIKIGTISGAPIEQISSISDIMKSLPIRQEIAAKLNEGNNPKFVRGINSSIKYTDETGLLKIKTINQDPAKAAEIIRVVDDIVLDRHEKMYLNAQVELDKLLKYVKQTINPVPLSSGINEFRITRTEIMVPSFVDKEPVPTKNRLIVIVVFIVIVFINTLLSFILEGRKK